MKKIVVFVLITALSVMSYAQNKDCLNPIPNQQYLQKYNQIKNKSTEAARLQLAKQIVKTYCFSSIQVQEIASLFENDYDRLEFAKAAYKNTTDKENFYDVYDSFIYYSVVFRLHDFISKSNGINEEETGIVQVTFPNLNYPGYKAYRGPRNCSSVIKITEFNTIAQEVNSINIEKDKYYKSTNLIQNKCLSTEQLMKLATLFKAEEIKLDFAKKAFESVYDIDNYVEMKQVFSTPRARSQFMTFLSEQGDANTTDQTSGTSGTTNCQLGAQEYQEIHTTIKNEKFNTNKLNTAKHLIKTNKCFSVLQVKGIVELFDYESSKLEISKFAFDFVTKKADYYNVISETLDFESSKRKLLDYMKSKSN